MKIVKLLVSTNGVHVRVNAIARLYLILCQRQTLPLGQRVYHLCLGIAQVLDGKGHGTLHAIQVVIDAKTFQHKQRSRHAAKPQLRRDVLLEKLLNQLNALLRLFRVKQ